MSETREVRGKKRLRDSGRRQVALVLSSRDQLAMEHARAAYADSSGIILSRAAMLRVGLRVALGSPELVAKLAPVVINEGAVRGS